MPERPPDISTDDASEVCIIGGGIGGLALAVGLQSRGVRCHVVERDSGWDERRRGYGLTLGPTCMTALTSLGLLERVRAVDQACPSDWHWVFAASGAILGYFGIAFSGKPGEARNFRVPRHELRRMLYEQLAPGTVRWGLRLESYVEVAGGVEVHLKPSLQRSSAGDGGGAAGGGTTGGGAAGGAAASKARLRCSVLVGADGVRSAVRAQKFGDALRYVGVVVVLGVCRTQHPLLRRGGFYTVDGTHRLFTMPYEPLEAAEEEAEAEAEAEEDGGAGRERAAGGRHSTMWQLSLAMPDEAAARALCGGGGEALLREVVRRCSSWHAPVGEMLAETAAGSVWGTPLCDRAPMRRRERRSKQAGRARGGGAQAGEAQPSPWASRVTLLGDAAHAMTPFKGQGANQTLVDAALLGNLLAAALAGRGEGGTASALARYEREMCDKAEPKVAASRRAALLYHSAAALEPGSYGVSGVPAEEAAALLAELSRRGVTASDAGALEARAVAAWSESSS